MKPWQIAAPTEAPVTLSDIKAHMRFEGDDEDTLIQSYINQAVAHLDGFEGVLGRCICTQTWGIPFRYWKGCLKLNLPNVQDVVVKYLDENDTEQTFPASDYVSTHDISGGIVWFKSNVVFPSLSDDHPFPITVEATAGYGGEADVPETVKGVIRMLVAEYECMREGVTDKKLYRAFGLEEEIRKLKWARI